MNDESRVQAAQLTSLFFSYDFPCVVESITANIEGYGLQDVFVFVPDGRTMEGHPCIVAADFECAHDIATRICSRSTMQHYREAPLQCPVP